MQSAQPDAAYPLLPSQLTLYALLGLLYQVAES